MFNLLCIIYIWCVCVYVWFHVLFCILFAIFIWGFLNFSSLEARCRVDSTIIEKRNCWPIPQLLAGIEPTRHSFYEFKGNPCQTFPCISNPIVTPRRGSNWQCDVIFQLEEIIRNHPNFLLSVSSCKCLRTGRTYTACLLLRTCLKGALMHGMSREMRFNRVHPMQSQDKQASCFFLILEVLPCSLTSVGLQGSTAKLCAIVFHSTWSLQKPDASCFILQPVAKTAKG